VWAGRARRFTLPVGFAMDAVRSILKCSIGGSGIPAVPDRRQRDDAAAELRARGVLFVPDLIFGKNRR